MMNSFVQFWTFRPDISWDKSHWSELHITSLLTF